jgi:phage-related protein
MFGLEMPDACSDFDGYTGATFEEMATSVFSSVMEPIESGIGALSTAVEDVGEAVTDTFEDAIEGVEDAIDSVGDVFTDAIEGVEGALDDVGDAVGSVVGAVDDVVDAVTDIF